MTYRLYCHKFSTVTFNARSDRFDPSGGISNSKWTVSWSSDTFNILSSSAKVLYPDPFAFSVCDVTEPVTVRLGIEEKQTSAVLANVSQKSWFAACAYFHTVNIPTVTNFRQPPWGQGIQRWEEGCMTGSQKPAQASYNAALEMPKGSELFLVLPRPSIDSLALDTIVCTQHLIGALSNSCPFKQNLQKSLSLNPNYHDL